MPSSTIWRPRSTPPPRTNGVGHVPIQRLSRTEFAASVKGLLGVDVDPKQILPTEIEVDGFSNIAGALAISPSFMEQYLSAARTGRAARRRRADSENGERLLSAAAAAAAGRPDRAPRRSTSTRTATRWGPAAA